LNTPGPVVPAAADRPGSSALGARAALSVLTTIFFTWGALTSLNDVLIPHLKAVFDMNYAQAMLVQLAFFSTYLVMAMPAGRVVSALGYKRGIIVGLLVAGVGALLFYPAAAVPSYPLFLLALFVLASGITVLQVAANPYVSQLGPSRTASSRLNLAQALNSLGHTLAPALLGPLILAVAVLGPAELALLSAADQGAYRVAQAQSVQLPYLGLALGLFLLAAFVWLFRLPDLGESRAESAAVAQTWSAAWRHRPLRFGVVAIFLYVGAEVAVGSFLINYITQPAIGGIDAAAATHYVSWYWGAAMVGRFIGAALLVVWPPRRMLMLSATGAALLLALTMSSSGVLAQWSVIAVGLCNAILFPTIFTLAIAGLGPLTHKGSSLLVMAIVGGAVIPVMQGLLADRIGVQLSFVVPLLCYGFVIWYGAKGSSPEGP
jgi:MFS transporter, FHS family, L-fucose permease